MIKLEEKKSSNNNKCCFPFVEKKKKGMKLKFFTVRNFVRE